MSDLISRQAAIDAIMGEPTDAHYPSWYAERLEQLPSAQQERIIYGNMSDEEFEKWLYGHGICSPNIHESIPCDAVPLLIDNAISELPSAQPEWNNHTVACLLAELFDDTCACNYNGIDEWLPEKCELLDSCPNPVGVACWEQYLKHRAERRTDG